MIPFPKYKPSLPAAFELDPAIPEAFKAANDAAVVEAWTKKIQEVYEAKLVKASELKASWDGAYADEDREKVTKFLHAQKKVKIPELVIEIPEDKLADHFQNGKNKLNADSIAPYIENAVDYAIAVAAGLDTEALLKKLQELGTASSRTVKIEGKITTEPA